MYDTATYAPALASGTCPISPNKCEPRASRSNGDVIAVHERHERRECTSVQVGSGAVDAGWSVQERAHSRDQCIIRGTACQSASSDLPARAALVDSPNTEAPHRLVGIRHAGGRLIVRPLLPIPPTAPSPSTIYSSHPTIRSDRLREPRESLASFIHRRGPAHNLRSVRGFQGCIRSVQCQVIEWHSACPDQQRREQSHEIPG